MLKPGVLLLFSKFQCQLQLNVEWHVFSMISVWHGQTHEESVPLLLSKLICRLDVLPRVYLRSFFQFCTWWLIAWRLCSVLSVSRECAFHYSILSKAALEEQLSGCDGGI